MRRSKRRSAWPAPRRAPPGRGPDGLSPLETIERITESTRRLGKREFHHWEDVVRPALAEHRIAVKQCSQSSPEELETVDRIFREQIFPALTPLAVGPGRPFPYISNLSLSIAVWLRDPVTDVELFARVKVPKEVLPRFIDIGGGTFVPLESIVARNLDALFPGMEVLRHAYFRVARDADFTVSDEGMTSCAPSSRSSAAGASVRWCGSR